MVKDLPAMLETCAQSLGQEDPLEKEMATHSSILAWRIPWTEDLPDPVIEPLSLMSSALAGGFFTTSATWEVIQASKCI